jgi:2-C-methyl-D-erythritol 4-phosphate cytidylyltransferase
VGITVALLLAAGSGSRLGRHAKGFVELSGVPMFVHSLRAMAACRHIDGVVMLVPGGYSDAANKWALSIGGPPDVEVRTGGETRVDSVRLGLDALKDDVEFIVCHDAARPFASTDLFIRSIAALQGVDGVIPAVPCSDTVKRVRGGRVIETVPRDELRLVQTPQAFLRVALVDAHRRVAHALPAATDDAMLLEAAGYQVAAIEGETSNFKITTPEDLRRAELLMAEWNSAAGVSEGAP